jgi:hypothetical protein
MSIKLPVYHPCLSAYGKPLTVPWSERCQTGVAGSWQVAQRQKSAILTSLMEDTYWQESSPLFTGIFDYYRKKPQVVHAKIHSSQERYYDGTSEIVPIEPHIGQRTYVNMHPYIEEPNVILNVGIPTQGYADTTAIGHVRGTRVEGFRQTKVGNIQAWYYPESKVLILWECFLERFLRGSTPLMQDNNMHQLWQQAEQHLQAKFPQAERVVTPFDDPLFAREEYQTFLRTLGYEPVARVAYGKLL